MEADGRQTINAGAREHVMRKTRWTIAICWALALCAWARSATTQTTPGDDAWRAAFLAYKADHGAHAAALISLARSGTDGLEPVYRIALAAAYYRTGRLATAARVFDAIRAGDDAEAWTGLATLKAHAAPSAPSTSRICAGIGIALAALAAVAFRAQRPGASARGRR
jgi:hypothetical protein